MEQDKPTKLDDNIVPYLKFFLLFHITYFISSITISILNSVSLIFFSFFNRFFDSLVLPIFNALFILITLKIILTYFPDFSNQKTIPFYIPIIAFVISSHPIDIYIDGDTFKVNYFTMDYFNYPNEIWTDIFLLIISIFLGFQFNLIQGNSKFKSSAISNYFSYLGQEIVLGVVLFRIIYSLSISFVYGNFESINLTNSIKLILILLWQYSTVPSK